MTNPSLVSTNDLAAMAGYVRPNRFELERWCDERSIRYFDGRDGPCTTLDLIHDASRIKRLNESQPWVSQNITPHDWMVENFDRFDFEEDHILGNCKTYTYDQFGDICSVYFLISSGRIVYVGKSNQTRTRLIVHSETKTFDSYFLIEGAPEELLEDIEEYYIHRIEPPLNVRYRTLPESATEYLRSNISNGERENGS